MDKTKWGIRFEVLEILNNYPRGGGQENYGLFPQFVTFPFWMAPLTKHLFYKQANIFLEHFSQLLRIWVMLTLLSVELNLAGSIFFVSYGNYPLVARVDKYVLTILWLLELLYIPKNVLPTKCLFVTTSLGWYAHITVIITASNLTWCNTRLCNTS